MKYINEIYTFLLDLISEKSGKAARQEKQMQNSCERLNAEFFWTFQKGMKVANIGLEVLNLLLKVWEGHILYYNH